MANENSNADLIQVAAEHMQHSLDQIDDEIQTLSVRWNKLHETRKRIARAMKQLDPPETKSRVKRQQVSNEKLDYIGKLVVDRFWDDEFSVKMIGEAARNNGSEHACGIETVRHALNTLHDRGIITHHRNVQGGGKMYKVVK